MRHPMRLVMVLVLGMWFTLNPLLPLSVSAHSQAITACSKNIKITSAKKVAPDRYAESTGLLAEFYDTNWDGRADIVTLSHTDLNLGIHWHHANPVFWVVDRNYDGKPDQVYVDRRGQGRCEDIVLYEDMLKPLDPAYFSNPNKAPTRRGGRA